MKTKIFTLLTIGTVFMASCTDKKSESTTSTTSQVSNNTSEQTDKAVEIPMHGTSENSSSSTNQRFEMNDDMKQMIQNEKSK
ncbi:hypothetical protein [Myroides phaeus]|uniref:Uncharacterized protein n=1 Tax=Myroides phaeus TaxID=702745 RepID=A0A1G8E7S9_9FLAO|nr:hypothetical protein [Myroides phaeus]MEC4115706.1 hypothetical protein [Myroides phaeus]SDH66006.1 hypothetical protein SAMN05421818_109117 [Myroides phaeus]